MIVPTGNSGDEPHEHHEHPQIAAIWVFTLQAFDPLSRKKLKSPSHRDILKGELWSREHGTGKTFRLSVFSNSFAPHEHEKGGQRRLFLDYDAKDMKIRSSKKVETGRKQLAAALHQLRSKMSAHSLERARSSCWIGKAKLQDFDGIWKETTYNRSHWEKLNILPTSVRRPSRFSGLCIFLGFCT